MKMDLFEEKPVYLYTGCCPEYGQKIRLYADDVRNANIGDEWSCSDQDRYPNRQYEWDVTVKVVYKDEYGVALLERDRNYPKLIWIELH